MMSSSSVNFSWAMPDDSMADTNNNHQEGAPEKILAATSSTGRRRSSHFSCSDSSMFRDLSMSELFNDSSTLNFDPFADSLVSSDEEDDEEVCLPKTTRNHHRLQHHKDEEQQQQKLPTSHGVNKATVSSSPPDASIPNQGVEDHATLLHRTCQQFPTNLGIIQTAIALDADAARRSASIPALGHAAVTPKIPFPSQNQKCSVSANANRKEPYHIPINIALHNHASLEVVQTLIEAAPEMLQTTDGGSRAGLTTLLIALQREPKNVALVKLILTLQPQAVAVMDTKHNTPLHVACTCACPLETIRLLYRANPGALIAKNFHGDTPKHVAERTSSCSEDVIDFFHMIRVQQAPQALLL